jgi:hypothetical protein
MELDIYMATWFKTGAELRHSATYTFGDATNATMLASQKCDDAICFTQLLGAQNNCFVTI